MTAEDFLREILANPDDDMPRLMFADWLEERGDPRGEFIRVQCELARLKAHVGQSALSAREQQLLAKHKQEWLSPLHGLAKQCIFHRGFVEELELPAEKFLQNAEQLIQLAPIRQLHLTEAGGHGAALAAVPNLRQIAGLHLEDLDGLLDEDAAALAASPHVAGLVRLELLGYSDDRGAITDEGVAALATSAFLKHLRELSLRGNDVTDEGIISLANSTRLPQLAKLDLGNLNHEIGHNQLGPAGAEALSISTSLAQLESLNLAWTGCDDRALATLVKAHFFPRLSDLDLRGNQITGQGAVTLLNSACVARRQTLALSENPLGERGAWTLANCPFLAGITSLTLSDCGLGDGAVQALLTSPYLARLTILDLNSSLRDDEEWFEEDGMYCRAFDHTLVNHIGDQGARALAECSQLEDIRLLQLEGSVAITAVGRELLKARFGRRVWLADD